MLLHAGLSSMHDEVLPGATSGGPRKQRGRHLIPVSICTTQHKAPCIPVFLPPPESLESVLRDAGTKYSAAHWTAEEKKYKKIAEHAGGGWSDI